MTETYSHPEQATAFEPGEAYRFLREQCPIHHEAAHDPPFYVVSRYSDVQGALKQPREFENRHGPGVFYQDAGVLGSTDDPDHARHRRVLRDAFLPAAVARMEQRVTTIAEELFDELLPRGEGDFVDLFAFPFPALVIGEMLGVRVEDRNDFRRWSVLIVEALTGGDLDAYEEAKKAIGDYIEALIDERTVALHGAGLAPGEDPIGQVIPDDVLSRMLIARRDGLLSIGEIRHLGHQLVVAGHETTTSLLGLMLYRLIERPEVMDQLRNDLTLLPAAIEESLRFDSPVQGLFRTNAHECELHGETIAPGSKVQMLFASANRDAERFVDPDEFHIDRSTDELRRHLAFGWGIHYCIGAPLARLETRVAFEQVLTKMHDIELAGPAVRNASFVLHGLTSLPIRWKVPPKA
jgi:cytochrome P450